jgi:DNA-binding transcriptional LysR family regulator
MRVTLRQIEAFYWTAKLGSVHAAAGRLNFSQPAVSARIRELEDVLALHLFTRNKQRLQLTPEGRQALPHAERVLAEAQDFERLSRAGPSLEGVLRLGADESTAMVALSEILSQLKRSHPKLSVELTIDVGTVLRDKLGRRELDVALLTNAGTAPHVVDEILGWVEFQWIASSSLALADGPFTPTAAATLPIVTNPAPSTLSDAVQKWLRSGGVDFDGVNTSNSLQLMLRLVQGGHAVAVLPMPILRDSLEAGELRQLPAQPPLPPLPYYASFVNDGVGGFAPSVIAIAKSTLAASGFFARGPTLA